MGRLWAFCFCLSSHGPPTGGALHPYCGPVSAVPLLSAESSSPLLIAQGYALFLRNIFHKIHSSNKTWDEVCGCGLELDCLFNMQQWCGIIWLPFQLSQALGSGFLCLPLPLGRPTLEICSLPYSTLLVYSLLGLAPLPVPRVSIRVHISQGS